MLKKFIDIDIFGRPITLNINGRRSYKTLPGALLTFAILIFLFYIITGKIIDYVEKSSHPM